MAIRITRNNEGNCITFVGSSNPAYWNACLSAQINSGDPTRVDIINDIRTANDPETQYEFYAVDFADFADKDNSPFTSAQEMVDYVNANANVIGLTDTGRSLNSLAVNFRLDDTSTSVIMDNGSAFGVNTIKAVSHSDGTIHINAIGTGVPSGSEDANDKVHFEQLDHTMVSVNGTPVSGGIRDVVNTLNELFTVGPFEAVVISDPYSTMVADVAGEDAGYTLEGADAIDPIGSDIFTYDGSGYANYAGLKSVATIDQAGEYYTFDIRGEGTIGFGLVHTQESFDAGLYSGNVNYANPDNFAAINSAHYGMQFSHWFHPTPNGSWTNYGANTGYSMRPGWSNWDQQADWLAGNPVKMRTGLDNNGYISIESLQDDGTWVVHARSSYVVPQGSSYHLGIKSQSTSARVATAPKVHLLEEEAPTMYFRYIESPDGVFQYPLFTTSEEAEYYDKTVQGSETGTSHTHTYADDPTNTTWYMPDHINTMTGTAAPTGQTFNGQPITYTEITSLTNSDLAPPTPTFTDLTYQEGTVVNMQLQPADTTYSTSASISPAGSGLVYNSTNKMLQGTLSDVTSDTVYTITVTRGNSYGSRTGSFTITSTDVAPPQTNDTPWTKALDFSGSNEHTKQVSNSQYVNAMRMGGYGSNVANNGDSTKTASSGYAMPWANTVVFRTDRNNSNQHIWNLGQGSGNSDKNIYLRTDASGNLYFGWGKGSNNNECLIFSGMASWNWYGVYVAHKGGRFSYGDLNVSNLADAFDIRIANASNNWTLSSNVSTTTNWTTGGNNARTDGSMAYDFTIGGRGTNRNFHGKVASMVMTTLETNATIPDNTEIELMITDPVKWVTDYKVGNAYRWTNTTSTYPNFQVGDTQPAQATQVWLMGDGTSDSYANGMRNYVQTSDQNWSKMQLNSMVSNDIQNVTISGLT